MSAFLLILDLAGTFVFAISGATIGVRRRLDLFGVLVLSFAASTAGGVARDLLIGAVPPVALIDWRYLAASAAAGLITFYRFQLVDRLEQPVLISDAAGLSLFAVTGALKALSFGLGPVSCILLGMLTGIGGGMLRDILVARIPMVLRAELYAIAALVGAGVTVIGVHLELPRVPVIVAGALSCFTLRFMAIRYGWRLPIAEHRETETPHE
ncbi:MAG TPA: trimeric intracellular cation channel family protein [Gammaproteobacteria bacterium]|nr:trimeric intracellular cation channel family protein [Gammaproteobacteria bacterium]